MKNILHFNLLFCFFILLSCNKKETKIEDTKNINMKKHYTKLVTTAYISLRQEALKRDFFNTKECDTLIQVWNNTMLKGAVSIDIKVEQFNAKLVGLNTKDTCFLEGVNNITIPEYNQVYSYKNIEKNKNGDFYINIIEHLYKKPLPVKYEYFNGNNRVFTTKDLNTEITDKNIRELMFRGYFHFKINDIYDNIIYNIDLIVYFK